jgi:Carboxypeptidase regulatory-like domain
MSFPIRGLFLLVVTAASAADTGLQAVQQPALPRRGVITGTVIDQSGKPLVGARVQAVGRRKKWLGPYYEISTPSSDDSDDRGQFRLQSLPPGRYVVAVSVQTRTPAPPEGAGYLRTYRSGTTSLADAQSIDVREGEEQSVSVRVTPVRFMTVSGIAVTSEGQPAASFDVWVRGGAATIGYTGAQGGFMTTMIATARAISIRSVGAFAQRRRTTREPACGPTGWRESCPVRTSQSRSMWSRTD